MAQEPKELIELVRDTSFEGMLMLLGALCGQFDRPGRYEELVESLRKGITDLHQGLKPVYVIVLRDRLTQALLDSGVEGAAN